GFALHCDIDTTSEWAIVWAKGRMTLYRIESENDQRAMTEVFAPMPVRELHERFLTWSTELEEPIRRAILLRLSEAVKQLG
ncbi:MAG: hypothetical protein ACREMY_07645, partial [bacterium]